MPILNSRLIHQTEIPYLASFLAGIFFDSGVYVYLFPDSATRQERLEWLFEKNLLLSTKSIELLNQCRDKSLACLSLSSSSISSILQLIINTENKIGFNTKLTSLNILRCLFVQDLLPIVLENKKKFVNFIFLF